MCGIAGFIDLWDEARAREGEERARILDESLPVGLRVA